MCITLNTQVFGFQTMQHNDLSEAERSGKVEKFAFTRAEKWQCCVQNNAMKILGYIPLMGLFMNLSGLIVGAPLGKGAEKNQRIFRSLVESVGLGLVFLPIDFGLMIKNSQSS